MKTRAFLFGIALFLAGLAHARADLCERLLTNKPVVLAASNQPLFTPEGAPTVSRMRATLGGIFTGSRSPELKRLYAAIRPQINATLKLAERVEALGYPQPLVAELAHRFSLLIEFPAKYLNELAEQATGGTNARVFEFDRSYYVKMARQLKKRYRITESKYLRLYAEEFAESFRATKSLLKDKFPFTQLRGTTAEQYEKSHFFQYRYIYRVGEVPMIEFIEIRETGEVFVGIKLGVRGDADGQYGLASDFEAHDYVHARTQKVKDQQLYAKFGVTKIAQARKLKALNQRELETLLEEWRELGDLELKSTVEVALFALLHEQSASFPSQVVKELTEADSLGFYRRALKSSLSDGRFKGLGSQKKVNSALRWILERAKASDTRVRKSFRIE